MKTTERMRNVIEGKQTVRRKEQIFFVVKSATTLSRWDFPIR
jgi:hypothetical protein